MPSMSQISPLIESGNGARSRSALTSTIDVVNALGGSRAAARLTGVGQSAACNWRNRDHFPPNTYLAMTQVLAAKGLVASAWLWDQEPRPPANSAKVEVGGQDDLWSAGGSQ